MSASPSSLPRWRFVPVWRRNALVWRKLALASLIGNVAEPLLTLAAFGWGVGSLVGQVDGVPYILFLASGSVCMGVMNAASFEATYSSFSRMHVQKTWDAILNTPLSLDDVLLGEWVWAASKALLSGIAILVIVWALGLQASFWMSLWIIPIVILIGFCFAGMGLVMNAVSPSYDFFLYYFTLVITPMVLLCGVFYPVSQLPAVLQGVSAFLPLTHAINLVRPIMLGQVPGQVWLHVLVLLAYGCVGFWLALGLTRKRLLS